MFIPIQYKYKCYPNAPKATGKSKALGVVTSFVAMALWSFLLLAVIGGVLAGVGLDDGIAYIIGAVLIIPFVYGILKWKRHIVRKIDKEAVVESIRMLSMTSEEKALMEQMQKKRGIKIAVIIWGGIAVAIAIMIIITKIS